MTKHVLTIEPESPILKAGGMMLAHGIHRLPIIKAGKLVGIVTREDIYSAILEQIVTSLLASFLQHFPEVVV